MWIIRALASVTTAAALTACQPPPPAPPARTAHSEAGLASVPSCADDTLATLDGGVRVSFEGSDPADADRCLVEWSGRSHPLYFGFWSHDPHEPMSEEARAALRTALTGPVGTQASFETERAQLWKGVTVAHTGNSTATVEGKPRPAIELQVVRHDAEGRPEVRAETHFWIDRATGVLLRSESVTPMANGGVTRTTSWEVGSLQQAG
jgi:hypothetical protein